MYLSGFENVSKSADCGTQHPEILSLTQTFEKVRPRKMRCEVLDKKQVDQTGVRSQDLVGVNDT